MNKILKYATISMVISISTLNATNNSNGFYIGIDTAFINIGNDKLDVSITIPHQTTP